MLCNVKATTDIQAIEMVANIRRANDKTTTKEKKTQKIVEVNYHVTCACGWTLL